jgi:hypothetical protein
MTYCINCGHPLGDSDRFCPNCGCPRGMVPQNAGKQAPMGQPHMANQNIPPQGDPSQAYDPMQGYVKRKTVYNGNIVKCPNCGQTLPAITTTCPACGYEFHNAEAPVSLSEFERRFQKLESNRQMTGNGALKEQFRQELGMDPILEQEAQLIRNFAIPADKENIVNLMVLASANIDAKALATQNSISSNYQLASAWQAKMEQAYHMALLYWGNSSDPDDQRCLMQIQEIYQNAQKQVKTENEKQKKTMQQAWIILILIFGMLFVMFIIAVLT